MVGGKGVVAVSPNKQNPDRGIETEIDREQAGELLVVQTNRIPTEGLKQISDKSNSVGLYSPNKQNPDRGIETFAQLLYAVLNVESKQTESRPRD